MVYTQEFQELTIYSKFMFLFDNSTFIFSPAEPLVVMYGTEIVIRVKNHQLLNSLTLRIHGLDNEWYQVIFQISEFIK